MTVGDIYNFLDKTAPFASKAEWDNPGLLVGDENQSLTKVVVALDITKTELEFAKSKAAQLIIAHHPVIFRPQNTFLKDSLCFELAANSISAICAHTNLDKAVGGVNDILCETLGFAYEKLPESIAEGFLNIAEVSCSYTADELAKFLSERLCSHVRYISSDEKIGRMGVCSGAGADFVSAAAKCGCNAFLTGDAAYHDFLEARELGVVLFAAGHFETENIIVDSLIKKLSAEFTGIEFSASPRSNPLTTVI